MIKALVIDDEPKNVQILSKMLRDYCPNVMVAGEAEKHEDAIRQIKETAPDLVFLDIEMPDGNAFDLLNHLMPVEFEIIFVTAYNQYAIKAFKYSALDYILKPVLIDDLQQAVQKATTRINEKNINNRLNNFLANSTRQYALSKIALPTNTGYVFCEVSEILYCFAQRNYTKFGFKDGSAMLVTGTLKDFEELLPAEIFYRIHNSWLVNLNHVMKYHKGKGGYLELVNGTLINVSFRKRDEFLEKLRTRVIK